MMSFLAGAVLLMIGAAAAASQENQTTSLSQVGDDTCPRGQCLGSVLVGMKGTYQLMPGVNITCGGVSTATSPGEALRQFLSSLTLHVALWGDSFISANEVSSRSKKTKFKFLSVYTVFAVAFALLSALVGKAMTISIVALIVAIVAARGGGFLFSNSPSNNSNSPPAYDIVRRPQIQVSHTHTAEEVYEAPDIPTATTAGGVSYIYPIRGRAVPEQYRSPYLPPTTIHVTSSPPDGQQTERHIHTS